MMKNIKATLDGVNLNSVNNEEDKKKVLSMIEEKLNEIRNR